jgi:hypothetical protein
MTATLVVAGCASSVGPVRFPSRPVAASPTQADDDALIAAGYVSLGPLEASVEKERCHGTEGEPQGCRPVDRSHQSGALLLARAAERGGDLVRVAHQDSAVTAPWIDESDCSATLARPNLVVTGLSLQTNQGEPMCVPLAKVVGLRRFAVSDGTVWRRDPDLVPNFLLERAAEAGDEARVVALLPRLRSPEVYVLEPPLLVAARKGHAPIVRRLLDAGLRAGREAALLAAVRRADEATTQILLASGVSAEVIDPETHERPLHLAAQRKGSAPILRLLIAAGADVNALDASDQMPLQGALLACDLEAARVLVEAHASRSWALSDATITELARDRCPEEISAIERMLAR